MLIAAFITECILQYKFTDPFVNKTRCIAAIHRAVCDFDSCMQCKHHNKEINPLRKKKGLLLSDLYIKTKGPQITMICQAFRSVL